MPLVWEPGASSPSTRRTPALSPHAGGAPATTDQVRHTIAARRSSGAFLWLRFGCRIGLSSVDLPDTSLADVLLLWHMALRLVKPLESGSAAAIGRCSGRDGAFQDFVPPLTDPAVGFLQRALPSDMTSRTNVAPLTPSSSTDSGPVRSPSRTRSCRGRRR